MAAENVDEVGVCLYNRGVFMYLKMCPRITTLYIFAMINSPGGRGSRVERNFRTSELQRHDRKADDNVYVVDYLPMELEEEDWLEK